jgi:hypothetical protein
MYPISYSWYIGCKFGGFYIDMEFGILLCFNIDIIGR